MEAAGIENTDRLSKKHWQHTLLDSISLMYQEVSSSVSSHPVPSDSDEFRGLMAAMWQ